MPPRQHAGMKIDVIVRKHSWLLALGLVAIVLFGLDAIRSPHPGASVGATFKALVHWRDAGHDWLLVADGKADQLIVYDVANGRPLRRLAIARGLDDAGALTERDGRLFVVDDDGRLDELTLPQLQLVASTEP